MADSASNKPYFGYSQGVAPASAPAPSTSHFAADPRALQVWQTALASHSSMHSATQAASSGGDASAPSSTVTSSEGQAHAWAMQPHPWGDASLGAPSRQPAYQGGQLYNQSGYSGVPSHGHPYMHSNPGYGGGQGGLGPTGAPSGYGGYLPQLQQFGGSQSFGTLAPAPTATATDPSALIGMLSQLTAVPEHGAAIQRLQEIVDGIMATQSQHAEQMHTVRPMHEELAGVVETQRRHSELLESLSHTSTEVPAIKDAIGSLTRATSEIHSQTTIIPTFSTAHEAILNKLVEQKATISALRTRLDEVSQLKTSLETAVSVISSFQSKVLAPIEDIAKSVRALTASVEASSSAQKKATSVLQEKVTALESALTAIKDSADVIMKPDAALMSALEHSTHPIADGPSTPTKGKHGQPKAEKKTAAAGEAKKGKRGDKKEGKTHEHAPAATTAATTTAAAVATGETASMTATNEVLPGSPMPVAHHTASQPATPTHPTAAHPGGPHVAVPMTAASPGSGATGMVPPAGRPIAYSPMELAWYQQQQQRQYAQRALMMNAAMQHMAYQQRLQAAATVASALANGGAAPMSTDVEEPEAEAYSSQGEEAEEVKAAI